MKQSVKQRIDKITLKGDENILFALKRMDELEKKLLIILQGNKFLGLISIGDLQRAIIRNMPMDTLVTELIRDDIKVARVEDSKESVRTDMMSERIECMPILDNDNNLVDVVFWEDIVENRSYLTDRLNLPVVIMAGGEGTRLKPLTNILPKPLIPIVDKTIIEDIMDQFVRAGCHDFYISINYKAEMIRGYLEGLDNPNYNLHFFQEEKPSGTAGSLSLLSGKINSSFFVSNCDIIIEQDLTEVYKYHCENKNDITVVAALKHYKIPYGTIESGNNGILTSLSEKPEITFKINSGVYILEPHTLMQIPKDKFFHITDLISKIRKQKGKVGIFPISEGSWKDYGLLENLPFVINR